MLDLVPGQLGILGVGCADDLAVLVRDVFEKFGTFCGPLVARDVDEPEGQRLFVRHGGGELSLVQRSNVGKAGCRAKRALVCNRTGSGARYQALERGTDARPKQGGRAAISVGAGSKTRKTALQKLSEMRSCESVARVGACAVFGRVQWYDTLAEGKCAAS